MLPTEEEKNRIIEAQQANSDIPLGNAEQFLLTLTSIHELEARLKLWLFKLDFNNTELVRGRLGDVTIETCSSANRKLPNRCRIWRMEWKTWKRTWPFDTFSKFCLPLGIISMERAYVPSSSTPLASMPRVFVSTFSSLVSNWIIWLKWPKSKIRPKRNPWSFISARLWWRNIRIAAICILMSVKSRDVRRWISKN